MQRFTDLPVSVDLPGTLGREVTAYVEAEAGWQVVGGQGPLVPALAVATAAGTGGRTVVVTDEAVTADRVRRELLAGALDVIAWPQERARLLDVAARLDGAPLPPSAVAPFRVAGCRGGSGTSTVALAVAATVAWAGGEALVVGGADLLRLAGIGSWTGPDATQLVALGDQAGAEVADVAAAVAGVPGLFVLRGGPEVSGVGGWPYDLVVVDVGTAGRAGASLLVGAADTALTNAAPGVPLLVVEHGPLDRAAVRRLLPDAPAGWLPYSARVARAGSAGRVPSALPGSWVAALRRALAGLR